MCCSHTVTQIVKMKPMPNGQRMRFVTGYLCSNRVHHCCAHGFAVWVCSLTVSDGVNFMQAIITTQLNDVRRAGSRVLPIC